MLIQVHTGNHVRGSEELNRRVEAEVVSALARFAGHVTRVDVHLNDVNAHKPGPDNRCLIEARPAGRHPVAVSCLGETVDAAVAGAAEKLERLLGHDFDRLGERKGRTSMGGDQTI
jgi:hypothetical protein